MRRVAVVLVVLAAFGAGYLTGRLASPRQRRGERSTVELTDAPVRPRRRTVMIETEPYAPGPIDRAATAPRESRTWSVVESDEFLRWYRVHERRYELPPASDDLLTDFGSNVIESLRRIPRPELLKAMLGLYRVYHAKQAQVGEEQAREFLQHFLDELHGNVAYSDYVLVWHSDGWNHWDDELVLRSPGPAGLAGADPYARPDLWAEESEHFYSWYRAYRHEFDLPALDWDSAEEFYSDVVDPLGRVPRPVLLRSLLDTYRHYRRGDPDDVSRERWEWMARRLFRDFKKLLRGVDYERMRYSDRWEDDCRELGILPE